VLRERDLPPAALELGDGGSQRIDALVHDMVEHSQIAGDIVQGERAGAAMAQLRSFMFEHVYLGPHVRPEHARISEVLRTLFDHYAASPEAIPDGGGAPGADHAQRITDYIAGMTDRYCIRAFTDLSVPHAFAL
jgi:dGTPase